uniref:SemiSWEET family sugar transporter n=1 Tax=Thaumasiovibrio occultus TaxID=1891184 RepID=UPI000B363D7E|nr:SemiSWEET transporter [Thaumasiovibrio occultus]
MKRFLPAIALLILPLVAYGIVQLASANITLLGSIAAVCTTFAYLPQVIKTIRTRDTRSISLYMYALMVFGVFCWFIYGYTVKDFPVMMANAITLLLSSVILLLKIREPATISDTAV